MRIPATTGPLLRRIGCTLLFCGVAPALMEAQGSRPGTKDAAALSFSALVVAEDNGSDVAAVDVRDPQYQDVQIYSILNAAIVLSPQNEKVQWQVSASTGIRHYQSQHEFVPSGQVVSASLAFPLGGRTTVSMSETAAYSPTYSLAPFLPGAQFGVGVSSTALDYGVVRSPNFSTFTSLSITRALTARATVSVGYSLNRMAFTNNVDPNLTSSNASARFNYRITRDASVHAGYNRRLGQYDFFDGIEDARVNDYDFGVDYSRALALSPSRRTTVNFSTGSSIYRDFDGRHYAFTGSANLSHRFGRTNELGLNYSRGVGFWQGLLTPVFTDTFTASTTSMLSRRLRVISSAGYVLGDVFHNVESDVQQTRYGAWTATGQFAFALTRRITLETGYSYYGHSIGDAVQLIGNIPDHQHRQMLFVGLSVGVPLISERSGTRR